LNSKDISLKRATKNCKQKGINHAKNKNKMKKALLIIDIQNDYFENGKMELVGPEEASKNAKTLLENFRDKNLPIIHIQHIAPSASATFLAPNTEGIKINKNVEPKENEKVITKHYPNGFKETELLAYLKSEEISELIICGMMTHMCIDSTARAAFDLGFKATVIGDACATRDLELDGQTVNAKEVQIAYLAALNGTFAEIQKTGNFII
jgi:nicotinamidase-related amidase